MILVRGRSYSAFGVLRVGLAEAVTRQTGIGRGTREPVVPRWSPRSYRSSQPQPLCLRLQSGRPDFEPATP
jgi:hypothetical protein